MLQLQNINLTKNNELQKAAQAKLRQLIPFDDDDLGMNDDGFFSAAQQQRLKPKTDLYIALSIIGSFVGFVAASAFFYVGRNSDSFVFATAFCMIVFGVCFYAIFWSQALAKQIKRGIGVKKVEGRAELSIVYTGKNNDVPNYNLIIKGVRFGLSREVFDAFAEGEYRIYYFRLLQNEILSVEPVV